MTRLLFSIFFTFTMLVVWAGTPDSIALKLNATITNKEVFLTAKEQNIQNLRQQLNVSSLSFEQVYAINVKLHNEYKKYKSDSAVSYVLKNKEIARLTNRIDFKLETDLLLAWLYSSRGMYIEAKQLLDNINTNTLPEKLYPLYYETQMEFCGHYGQSNENYTYYKKSDLYRDSLLSILDPLSLQYQVNQATKIFYEGEGKESPGERQRSEQLLLDLLHKTNDKNPERAMIAYLLGHMYKGINNVDLQIKYFSISAIADIENSIKDNASLHSLALVYYEMGDIDKAYLFMDMAVNDALFCKVRYRTVTASAFYPIINASYQTKEKKQKTQLETYLNLISILSVALIGGVIGLYMQMKRLSRTRKSLYASNAELTKLNNSLHNINEELRDANRIKEEYIARFFDLCSTYIDKIENYRKTLNKKASSNQLAELFSMLKSTSIVENELADLYKNFDEIFLNLYPSFIDEFNMLLLPEEQIIPKPDELLNTELRIFALIRLGIIDSVKIASFLRYSLRTIYNYRTKVRNKSAVPRDEFEDRVKKIGSQFIFGDSLTYVPKSNQDHMLSNIDHTL